MWDIVGFGMWDVGCGGDDGDGGEDDDDEDEFCMYSITVRLWGAYR